MHVWRIRPIARWLAVGVACSVISGLAITPTRAVGQSATLQPVTDDGVPRIVASHKGKVVLVNFWATWCSPCRAELPHLLKLEKELAKQGFQLVVISADEPEQEKEAIRFLDSIGAPRPRYIKKSDDNDAFINAIDSAWSGALPALFLYDRTGKRVRSFVGETEIAVLAKAIREVVGVSRPREDGMPSLK